MRNDVIDEGGSPYLVCLVAPDTEGVRLPMGSCCMVPLGGVATLAC
jgi:hypothetical protein